MSQTANILLFGKFGNVIAAPVVRQAFRSLSPLQTAMHALLSISSNKWFLTVSIALAAAVCANAARAQDPDSGDTSSVRPAASLRPSDVSAAILGVDNQYMLGFAGNHVDNRSRYGAIDPYSTETGWQNRYSFTARSLGRFLGLRNIYSSSSISLTRGTAAFDGRAAGQPYSTSRDVKMVDFWIKLGRAFALDAMGQSVLIPYLTYSSHSGRFEGHSPVVADANVFSHRAAGIGMLGQYAISDKWVASVNLDVQKLFAAETETNGQPASFKTEGQYLVSGGAALDYALTRHLHLGLEYKVSDYRYKQSAVTDGVVWPRMHVTDQALMVSLGVRF